MDEKEVAIEQAKELDKVIDPWLDELTIMSTNFANKHNLEFIDVYKLTSTTASVVLKAVGSVIDNAKV